MAPSKPTSKTATSKKGKTQKVTKSRGKKRKFHGNQWMKKDAGGELIKKDYKKVEKPTEKPGPASKKKKDSK